MSQTKPVVFINDVKSCSYYFKNGDPAIFVNGKYITDDPRKIRELDAEIESRHPNIRRATDQDIAIEEMADPLAALKRKIREEIIAEERAKATNLSNDMGNSEPGKFTPASTTTIAPVAAGAGPISAAALSNLMAKHNTAAAGK